MSTSINTNISALAAQSSLRKTGLAQATAMERLSTGIRINNAKDDAAGLAISTRMTANIRGISAAIRNANDGISLTQTAEGSLAAIGDNLQRIRELAVQSSNTGNNASDRSALNAEATQLIAEINRVADNTAFNGIKLLDGTFQNQALQVGSGNDTNDRITVSINSAKANSLGIGGASWSTTKAADDVVGSTPLVAGALTLNGIAVGQVNSDGVSFAQNTASGIAVAAAINAVSAQSSVTATVAATTVAAQAVDAAKATTVISAGEILINGIDIGGIASAGGTTAGTHDVIRGSQVAAAVNSKSTQTGVTATYSLVNGGVTLSAADGRNITISTAKITGVAGIGKFSGTQGTAAVTTTTSKITLSSTSSSGITVGGQTADALTAAGFTGNSYSAAVSSSSSGVSSVDISTAAGAQSSLNVLDKAINTVTDSRASMGAYQNRLTAAISNLETTSMNLQASRSRILDTDYAKETTNLAKSQIITQAATAMLAQANQSAQSVLALLK
jgi:flagellin